MNLKTIVIGLVVSGITSSALADDRPGMSSEGEAKCLPVNTVDEWRAYDGDTLSVYGNGRELARFHVVTTGPSDTWMMHQIHKVRFETGADGLLCSAGSDTMVLDGRRHFIERIDIIDPQPVVAE
jgi:hypothetical protein